MSLVTPLSLAQKSMGFGHQDMIPSPGGFLVSVRTLNLDLPSKSLLLVEESFFSGWVSGCSKGKLEAVSEGLEFCPSSSSFCKPDNDNSTQSCGEAQRR